MLGHETINVIGEDSWMRKGSLGPAHQRLMTKFNSKLKSRIFPLLYKGQES